VTGVQTCALPIYNARVLLPEHLHLAGLKGFENILDRMGVAPVIERLLELSN